jgi:hypothetical protein
VHALAAQLDMDNLAPGQHSSKRSKGSMRSTGSTGSSVL